MKTKLFPTFLLAMALTTANPATASQKEDHPIAAPLVFYPGGPTTTTLTAAQVRALVLQVFPNAATSANQAFMIHAVQYQNDKLSVLSQSWYSMDFNKTNQFVTAGDLHAAKRFQDPRLFGRSHLGVVYLHILQAVPANTVEQAVRTPEYLNAIRNSQKPPAASPNSSAAEVMVQDAVSKVGNIQALGTDKDRREALQTRLTNLQAQMALILALPKTGPDAAKRTQQLEAILPEVTTLWTDVAVESVVATLLNKGASGMFALIDSASSSQLVPFNGFYVKAGVDSLSSLAYDVSIESKDKAPYVNFKTILGLAFAGQATETAKLSFTLVNTPFAAGGAFDTALATSNAVVTATYSNGGKDTQIGTQTYDNEGRYWYDFSMVVPVRSFHDVTYDSTANGLAPRTITKNNVFAAMDIGLPRDTKNLQFQVVPTLLYGLPIAGQPLKHHLFAASIGLNYLSFFVGTTLDQENFYHDFTKPLTGDNVFKTWRTHLTYGINLNVATVAKALGKSK